MFGIGFFELYMDTKHIRRQKQRLPQREIDRNRERREIIERRERWTNREKQRETERHIHRYIGIQRQKGKH
jgi:hypothetical protein